MKYTHPAINETAELLAQRFNDGEEPASLVKSKEMKALFAQLKGFSDNERREFGSQLNLLRSEILNLKRDEVKDNIQRRDIDITAPFDENCTPSSVRMAPAAEGSLHPLSQAMDHVLTIFEQMGFTAIESRMLDDDYHMFGSLNFPDGHPARDDYDTFVTEEGLIAPAHTSTMQNRVLRQFAPNLEAGEKIQMVVPGRCFRNEDIDARHEHTLHQVEGVMVGDGITTGNLIATLKVFLEAFYGTKLNVKTQPAYFPFVEPGFEFSMSCPFCSQKGCSVCSHEGWIEILGCGLIHPNVLREADIDADKYTGFAWGVGLDRLVMMQYGIDDIRLLQSGKLEFLEQFS